MAFAVELEEWVGAHWHRFITRHASGEFEAARVTLESMRRPLGMLFRALGGAPGVALEATPARRLLLRRTWLQRVAGTCEQAPVSWFNGDSLRLPESLAVYPQAELNRELYRWLALLAASAGPLRHWAQDNQRWARPAHLEKTALHLRRQFACLRDGRQRLRQRPQGDEIDLDAWLDFQVERRRGGSTQPGLFLEQRPRRRDLACLLLADLSMSTEAYLDDQRRVIDSIVDSLLLFGEALQALGDPFALYGFSSVRRQQVRWQVLKDFDEGYGGEVRGRVLALSPGYYTRMGAAIRRASQVLGGQPQKRRLLLLLSDGKPNDLDRYEGRYGIEDTRQAVIEARSQGLVPFCITIDREAADYLPYLFGADGFALVERAGQLPERLLQLYRRLRR
ncbi:norD [Pseudomonas aeruginosa VRFPA01]|nr:norD [Pseudomonas aeruginosa VRFPA01]